MPGPVPVEKPDGVGDEMAPAVSVRGSLRRRPRNSGRGEGAVDTGGHHHPRVFRLYGRSDGVRGSRGSAGCVPLVAGPLSPLDVRPRNREFSITDGIPTAYVSVRLPPELVAVRP